MLAKVEGIELFLKPFDGGIGCPQCGKRTEIISTTNDWKYWCRVCDIRFNNEGVRFEG